MDNEKLKDEIIGILEDFEGEHSTNWITDRLPKEVTTNSETLEALQELKEESKVSLRKEHRPQGVFKYWSLKE